MSFNQFAVLAFVSVVAFATYIAIAAVAYGFVCHRYGGAGAAAEAAFWPIGLGIGVVKHIALHVGKAVALMMWKLNDFGKQLAEEVELHEKSK